MTTNPDNDMYNGFGSSHSYLVPIAGMLRFVQRKGENATLRILQRYEWSSKLGKHDWFDVGMGDDDEPAPTTD